MLLKQLKTLVLNQEKVARRIGFWITRCLLEVVLDLKRYY